MVALAVLFSLLALLPPGFVVAVGIVPAGRPLRRWCSVRASGSCSAIRCSARLTVPACIALGVTVAWLTERTTGGAAGLVGVGGCPAGDTGVCAELCPGSARCHRCTALLRRVPLGACLLSLYLYASSGGFAALDPTLEDVAASLGTPPWLVFFSAWCCPRLKLAICGGALLVALRTCWRNTACNAMIRFDTFTTAIYDQFQSTFSGPAANMLGVLAYMLLAFLLLESVTRGKARYARIGARAAREQNANR